MSTLAAVAAVGFGTLKHLSTAESGELVEDAEPYRS